MDEPNHLVNVILPIFAVFCGLMLFIFMRTKKDEQALGEGSTDTEVEAYIKANGMSKGFVVELKHVKPMVYRKVPGGIKFFIPDGDKLNSLWHDNGGKYQNWYFGTDDGKCTYDWHTRWWSEEAEKEMNGVKP